MLGGLTTKQVGGIRTSKIHKMTNLLHDFSDHDSDRHANVHFV
jgi:hypothetical protein